jgi:hypothetical protein
MLGQFPVLIGHHIPCVVGGEPYFHGIPYIGPLGMMVHCFRDQGYAGHKGKGLIKVLKLDLFVESVIGFVPHKSQFDNLII